MRSQQAQPLDEIAECSCPYSTHAPAANGSRRLIEKSRPRSPAVPSPVETKRSESSEARSSTCRHRGHEVLVPCFHHPTRIGERDEKGTVRPADKSRGMKHLMIGVSIAAVLALGACGKSSNVSTQSAVTGAPASGGTVLEKAGTRFTGKLQNEIATNKSHDGDTFTIVSKDGATVDGHLGNVSPAGMGKKPALTLVFDDIKLADGSTAPIDVRLVNVGAFGAKSHHWRTVGMVLGGGMAGHIAAGKHHGGMVGAAGGYALSQEMKTNVDVKPGTRIVLQFVTDAVAASPAASPSGQ